ncbi:hypothetical protein C9426_01025 [Serratia sp. S1B]|nr:hypothetical protein C9426_01025 [Serratia sp. S1B]
MSLIRGYQMFLTNNNLQPNIYFVKTMVCNTLYVNDGNDKNHRSHSRSHDKALKYKNINTPCERVNNFSRAHVGNYFLTLSFSYFLLNISSFIFLHLACTYIFLFTRSHLIKINIKTNAYHVNDLKNSFTCRSHGSHGFKEG